jgi:hypothetical protein
LNNLERLFNKLHLLSGLHDIIGPKVLFEPACGALARTPAGEHV